MGQPITFNTLKSIAMNDPTVQENIEDLKSMFRNEIGTARNMYRIHTVADLFDCLERRDALSPYNIEVLREIADEFGGELADIVTNYHVPKTLELRNEYSDIRMSYEMECRLHMSGVGVSGVTNNGIAGTPNQGNKSAKEPVFAQVLSKEKNAAIQRVIACDIGSDWRSFGRELEVCQGDLDNIEINYRDIKTRVYKLFQVFEENDSIDPKNRLLVILEALEQCRRKDLCRSIKKIMSH